MTQPGARRRTEKLTSVSNPRIKSVVALAADRHERASRGLAVVEGAREIGRALACGFEPVEVYACEPVLSPPAAALLARPDLTGLRHDVSETVFTKLAVRDGSDGLVMVFRTRSPALADLLLGARPLLVAAQGVEKPGNLGALVRTADAVGADAVVALDRTVDPWNPHVIRGSVGTVFRIPVISAGSDEFRDFCRDRGLTTCVAALNERAEDLFASDLRGPVAIVLGREDTGVTADWLAKGDRIVALPMRGIADSLNLSVAGAVMLYEALRQRRG